MAVIPLLLAALAPVSAGTLDFDVAAQRAYLRSGPNAGAEVASPEPGQAVYFHIEWSVTGSGGRRPVTVRALLDGAEFCTGSYDALPGTTVTLWCNQAWTASAGTHALLWQLDFGDDLPEPNEANNSAGIQWTIASATHTPISAVATATATSTPTRSRTASPTDTPVATSPTPTSTPRAATSTPRSPTPSRTPPTGLFPRADSDCSLGLAAADVVAAARALAGDDICGNDDCDRDGDVDPADLDCSARCLFGSCPVPPHAPRITGVTPVSAGVVPYSVVRVEIANLASTSINRATIGGADAPLAGAVSEGAVWIVVPSLTPGPSELVVFAGDLASAPARLVVSAPTPIGAPDTFAGTLALLDGMLVAFAALDLKDAYGANASLMRDAIARLRLALEQVDDGLGAAERAQLDAALDAAGIADLLRLRDGTPIGGAAGAPTVVLQAATRIVQATRIVAASATAAAPLAPGLATLAAASVVVAGVVGLGAALIPPVILSMQFTDLLGETRLHPTAAGEVRVIGARLGPIAPRLRIQRRHGEWQRDGVSCGSDCLSFHLPEDVGFCGGAVFSLVRGLVESNFVTAYVEPELIDLSPARGEAYAPLSLVTRGALGCDTALVYRPGNVVQPAVLEYQRRVPDFPPRRYLTTVQVDGVESREQLPLDVTTRVDFIVGCDSPWPIEAGRSRQCKTVGDIPGRTTMRWASSRPDVVAVPRRDLDPEQWYDVHGLRPGAAILTAAAISTLDGAEYAQTRAGRELEVEDTRAPVVSLLREPPDAPLQVMPGGTIRVAVAAQDQVAVKLLQLDLEGDAVAAPRQQESCFGLAAFCVHTFTVRVREDGFGSRQMRLVGSALDTEDNQGESEPLVYEVVGLPTPLPTPPPTAPPASVRAYVSTDGDSVAVVDVASRAVITAIPVGHVPDELGLTPDGTRLLVVNAQGASVSIIDTNANEVVATIPVRASPNGLAMHPSGRYAYLTHAAERRVTRIDVLANAVAGEIELTRLPIDLALSLTASPDGDVLYVGSARRELAFVDAGGGELRRAELSGVPANLAAAPDGARVYARLQSRAGLDVIDASSGARITTVPLGDGFNQSDVAVSPDSRWVYATSYGARTLSVIDAAINAEVATIETPGVVRDLALTPDGSEAWVATGGSRVLVLDTSARTFVQVPHGASVSLSVAVGAVP